MSDIDWSTADSREWYVMTHPDGHYSVVSVGDHERILTTKNRTRAEQAALGHNYLLAQERRDNWYVTRSDGGYVVCDAESGDYDALCPPQPTRLAAMAEFVRLDKEMPK